MSLLSKSRWSLFLAWHVSREGRLPFAPASRVESLRRARTASLVQYAYRRIGYYRKAIDQTGLSPEDFRSPEDLARLPLLTKQRLIEEHDLCSPPPEQRPHGLQMESSGTSGRPHFFYHDAASLFMNLAGGRRLREAMAPFTGRVRGCREAVIARRGGAYAQLREFYRKHGPPVGGGTEDGLRLEAAGRFEEELTALNKYRPEVIRGYGSYLSAFLSWVHAKEKPFEKPKAVIYGADAMPEAGRRLIEESMGIPVFATYQAVEALRIGYQCELRQGLHLYADQVDVRVVDKLGNTLQPPAAGDIVISNLVNRGTVLFNYLLGDVVTLTDEPCPCGRTGVRILRIDGREDDLIALPDGASVFAHTLLVALQEIPGVAQIQVEQLAVDRVVVRTVARGEYHWDDLAAAVVARTRAVLGFPAQVAVENAGRIEPGPGGKVRGVISRVGLGRG